MSMELLLTEKDLKKTLGLPIAVIFKHSHRCPISAKAKNSVISSEESNPDCPFFMVDVIDQKDLSGKIASLFSIPHESPQVFLLAKGIVIWNASHFDISKKSLNDSIAALME